MKWDFTFNTNTIERRLCKCMLIAILFRIINLLTLYLLCAGPAQHKVKERRLTYNFKLQDAADVQINFNFNFSDSTTTLSFRCRCYLVCKVNTAFNSKCRFLLNYIVLLQQYLIWEALQRELGLSATHVPNFNFSRFGLRFKFWQVISSQWVHIGLQVLSLFGSTNITARSRFQLLSYWIQVESGNPNFKL